MPANAPSLTVLGLYSPKASETEYQNFIDQYIAESDPANFDQETKDLFKRFGREAELIPFDDVDRASLREEIEAELGSAAYVEVLVSYPDERFDMIEFVQQDSATAPGFGQVAWNETYLSEDGSELISGYPSREIPKLSKFRVVFVIHSWQEGQTLYSPYGELAYPEMEPLPERIWCFAPYERVD
jgi:hypothetical protein